MCLRIRTPLREFLHTLAWGGDCPLLITPFLTILHPIDAFGLSILSAFGDSTRATPVADAYCRPYYYRCEC